MSAAASASNDPHHVMQVASLLVVPESDCHDTKAIAAERQRLESAHHARDLALS